MTVLLGLYLVSGLVIVAAGQRARRWAIPVAVVAPLATLAWLLAKLPGIVDGEVTTERARWVPELGLGIDLRLDGFSAVMLLLVAGVGTLVVAYAHGYFSHPDERTPRLIGLLVLFAGSMVGLVVADNLLVLYGFWELTSITSFLLIGNKHEDAGARAAALQALLITGLGALAMLAGFVVLGQSAGTYRLSAILADPPSGTAVSVALVLILLGAFTKSAQMPFHSWLPGAMVAPTPVSTYLHSATMVKAGVYLVGRLAPAFAGSVGFWRPLVIGVGAVTMIGGGLRAMRQTDLKLLLAMGTVSQLGFLIIIFGWGSVDAAAAGTVMLLAHGAFKAAAFMLVGIIDHQAGTRDVRRLPRPSRSWWPFTVAAVVAAASMAGLPLCLGFIGKEAVLEALGHAGTGGAIARLAVVVGSALTAAYSARFVLGITGRLAIEPAEDEPDVSKPGRPATGFVAPSLILTIVTVVLGTWPALADGVVSAGSAALTGIGGDVVEGVHLAVWHGFNVALLLSALALAGGLLMVTLGTRLDRVLALGDTMPTSAGAYRASLRGLNVAANRVTSVTQPGSLPVYLGVILVTAVAVPTLAMFRHPWWSGWPRTVDSPIHAAVGSLVLGAALLAAAVRRRFTAAIFLGLCGYAMAALFLVHGAPDLALTQVAIETLTTVLFVLVLRRLPDRFEEHAEAHRMFRRFVAAAVGAGVFVLTLAASGARLPTNVSNRIIADAYPLADGRNVVNVILVDFRGMDTMGELTVLAAAAIGTVALARVGRRRGDGAAIPPPVNVDRLVIVDVGVRFVFAAVIMGSLWLLFAGHNQPGGGFVGGIVAGAGISLRYVSGGIEEVRSLSRRQPWLVLGSGLLIAVLTATVPVALGQPVLASAAWTWELPLLGTVKLTSPLFFDIGVYLLVVGLALMVFESFGDDPESTHEVMP